MGEDGRIDTETFSRVDRLRALRIQHRELDAAIRELSSDPAADQFQLRRLKKRKLMLKDQITRLESSMIPDLNA